MEEATKIPPAEINEVLIRRLQEHNEILPASKILMSCQTNERRVSFVYDLIVENGCLPQLSLDGKSNAKSLEYRQKGNEMFKQRKSKEAHEFYTKSIAFAEIGHETLPLAYANRSTVLFENRLYEECSRDIDRALKCNNYPENLKPKLLARQLKAKELQADQEKVDFFTPIPSILFQNPLIQAASSSIKIENSATLGRHIVATKDIEPGEIIAIERPYCHVLIDQLYSHCHHCLKLCYTLISCLKCTEAMFCSEFCQEEGNKAYHQYECSILLTIKEMDLMTRLLHLRITILARDQYEMLDQCALDDVYRSDRYNEIHNLVGNTSKRSASDLFTRASYAAAFYHLLKFHTDFFQAKDAQFESHFKELLLLHLQIGACNFHEVAEMKSSDNSMEQEEIGAAAYSFLSMFNHSCCPNIVRYSYGSTAVVIALEGIKVGEQCFDNYGYHHAVMSKSNRQAQLKKQYFFDCNCEACKNDYPLYDSLPELQDEKFGSISTQDLKYLQDNNLQEAQKIYEKLKRKILEVQQAKPNKNLAELQESLKHCCFIFRTIKTPI